MLRTGDLSRNVDDGHECHMYRLDELLTLRQESGLRDIELSASGWLVPNGECELPEAGSDEWEMLMAAELQASAEAPGAGTHIIAWGIA